MALLPGACVYVCVCVCGGGGGFRIVFNTQYKVPVIH